MIREFNYTQRKRIDPRHVNIELTPLDDATRSFNADLTLDDLQLPADAPLVLEASRNNGAMRFDWGTVGCPQPAGDRQLSEVGYPPTFRVMALSPDGSRRILALGNRIKPKWNRGDTPGVQGLVYLEEADLGREVWRLDPGELEGIPVLRVNREVAGISQAVRNDPAFRSLVFPQVLRTILTHILLLEEADPTDTEGGRYEWFGFVSQFYPEQCPPLAGLDADAEKRQAALREWIDGAVKAFTNTRFNASRLYAEARR